MQVFLPEASVVTSLEILDKRRLTKQRVEAKQLIDTILDRPTASGKPRKGWKNHPAAVMFKQYLPFLVFYYNCSLKIHEYRGGKNDKLKPEQEIEIPEGSNQKFFPWWYGSDEIHATHRSRLLFKGKLDVLSERIRKGTGVTGVNSFLKDFGFPTINECRQKEYDGICQLMKEMNIPEISTPNHYDQFNWSDSDQLEYLWPGEFPTCGVKLLR